MLDLSSDIVEASLSASVQNWSMYILDQVRRGHKVIVPVDLPNAGELHGSLERVTHATSCLLRGMFSENHQTVYHIDYYRPEGREGNLYLAGEVDKKRTDSKEIIRRGSKFRPSDFVEKDKGIEQLTPNRYLNRKTKSFMAHGFTLVCPSLNSSNPDPDDILKDCRSLTRILACYAFLGEAPSLSETRGHIENALFELGDRKVHEAQRVHGVQGEFACEYKSSVGPLANYFDDELTFQVARYCFRNRALEIVNTSTLPEQEKPLKKALKDKVERAGRKIQDELRR